MYKFCLYVFVRIVLLMAKSLVRIKRYHLSSSQTDICLCNSYHKYLYDLLSGTLLGTENLFNLDKDFLLVYSFLLCISFLEY